jgi:hypothetical protein
MTDVGGVFLVKGAPIKAFSLIGNGLVSTNTYQEWFGVRPVSASDSGISFGDAYDLYNQSNGNGAQYNYRNMPVFILGRKFIEN